MQQEDQTIIRTLYVFMLVALAGSAVVLISALLQFDGSFRIKSLILSGVVGLLACLISLWMLRIERFTVPRVLLPSVIYLLATYLIFTGETVSVRDDAVLMYALAVSMAGLLLSRRGVVIYGALSVVTVLAAVYAELQGKLVNHITAHATTYATLATAGVIYGLTFLMMYILVNILTDNLARSRADQLELSAANAQLLLARQELEKQVEARTRVAEKARAAAEAARQEAETQMWFAQGQAQFAERLRGDLDSAVLAQHITAYLSRYVGADCGALFVSDGGKLKLKGHYAFTPRPGQQTEFRLREGLVGEAARAKRLVRLDALPAQALPFLPAADESASREILLLPLESNGQVFGVLVLAASPRFLPRHETFLNSVSESAAIALRTAQTRAQLVQVTSLISNGN